MILTNNSDASYLSDPKAHIRYEGHFYMGKKTTNRSFLHNGAILSLCKIFRSVMASSAEEEIVALFENEKAAAPLFHALD